MKSKKPSPVLLVELVDAGQDFTTWFVENGKVIDCQPCQQRAWVNTRVFGKPQVGEALRILTVHTRSYTTLNHLPEEVRELSEDEAAEVRARYREFMKELINE